MKKKTIALLMAMVMLFGVVVGSTIAWLQAESEEVVNTFTFGDINIDLNETDVDSDGKTKANAYDLIPGDTSVKDPKVTVLEGSEDCYVFVKVTEDNNELGDGKVIEYTVDSTNWLLVDTTNKIYVYTAGTKDDAGNYVPVVVKAEETTVSILAEITETDEDGSVTVIDNNHIKVNEALTKANITAMAGDVADTTDDTYPTISFDACAVQSDNIEYDEAEDIAIGLLTGAASN